MGSDIPKNEFIISLGSKATSDAPMIANFFATNFLHKKYLIPSFFIYYTADYSIISINL